MPTTHSFLRAAMVKTTHVAPGCVPERTLELRIICEVALVVLEAGTADFGAAATASMLCSTERVTQAAEDAGHDNEREQHREEDDKTQHLAKSPAAATLRGGRTPGQRLARAHVVLLLISDLKLIFCVYLHYLDYACDARVRLSLWPPLPR